MSDQNEPVWRAPEPGAQAAAVPSEFVLRGLFFALAAVIAGSVIAVVLWDLNVVASISSFVIALGAVYLYVMGAGAAPRKGLLPLILLIVIGVVVSFFAVVADDLWRAFPQLVPPGVESRWTFVSDNVFNPSILRLYGRDAGMFFLFALLGMFGVLRRVMRR